MPVIHLDIITLFQPLEVRLRYSYRRYGQGTVKVNLGELNEWMECQWNSGL